MKSAVLAVALMASVAYGARSTPDIPIADLRAVTVKLQMGAGSCTGVVTAPGVVLTAAHCTVHGDIKILRQGLSTPAAVTWVDYYFDIAELSANVSCPCMPLALEQPPVDSKIVHVGHQLSAYFGVPFVTEGRIMGQTSSIADDITGIAATLPAAPGGSGGGIFSRHTGRWALIGLLSQTATRATHLTVYADVTSPRLNALREAQLGVTP